MSAIKAVYDAALTDLHAAAAKLEAIGHDAWDRVKALAAELEADAPKIEAEAAADAADVVKTAENQGIVAAEQAAVNDVEALAADTGHDIAAAVEGSGKPPAQDAPAA